MNSKTLIGGIISGIVSFFLGWLLFGMLLHSYYMDNTTTYAGLFKANPTIWALAIANLCWGFLLAYIMNISGANSVSKGFTCGLIIFFLVALGSNMFSVGLMHLIRIRLALVDTAISALFGGVNGAIVGWWYSRSVKA